MKSENIITKAMVLAICMLILAAMSAVCIASTTAYSAPIGTGAADFADNNLASAYSREFATGYTASVDGWSEDIRLTTASAFSDFPEIAVDTNNNVHITWEDKRDGNYEIYYTKLDNNGNTLVDDTRLTTDSSYSRDPTIAVDTNNNVHITWNDNRDGNYEIYYTKLDNNGNTLVDDTRLTTASSFSEWPAIAVDTNNNVHITWDDKRDGNWEIYYTKLDNNGNTLVDDTRLTTDYEYSWYPAIAVDTNNNVHITWHDERDVYGEIYYTKLDNNGNTLVDDTRLTTNDASSWDPTIAVDTNNYVHITWYDQRDGYHEIYYKHTIASVTSPTVSIYTDKTSYTAGDTMRLGLDVTNPGDALPVRFAVWLEQPGGGIYVLTYTSVTLPAGLEYSNPDFMVLTLPGIAAGTYTWNAAIIEPSGPIEFISHDTAEWEFVSMGAPMEDITGVLKQTTIVIDFAE